MNEDQFKEKRVPKNPIKFKISLNQEQKDAKSNIMIHPYNFIKGEAGCGKTLLACQVALDLVFKREKNKIIITRPTVGTEDNGFLPGSLDEKMEPWMVPIKSNMSKLYDNKKIETMYKDNEIEMISLSHFRGRTFDNSVCIIDEFQNLTRAQLQMAIGRLGQNSIMIFCGDRDQIDLKTKSDSAIHEVSKIEKSQYVYSIVLQENHRNEAVSAVLKLLNDY
jgi:phosphate starvation-inducible PhoH-like protein